MIIHTLKVLYSTNSFRVISKNRTEIQPYEIEEDSVPVVWNPEWPLSIPTLSGVIRPEYNNGREELVEFAIVEENHRRQFDDDPLEENLFSTYGGRKTYYSFLKDEEYKLIRKLFNKVYVNEKEIKLFKDYEKLRVRNLIYSFARFENSEYPTMEIYKPDMHEFWEMKDENFFYFKSLALTKKGNPFMFLKNFENMFVLTKQGLMYPGEAFEFLEKAEITTVYFSGIYGENRGVFSRFLRRRYAHSFARQSRSNASSLNPSLIAEFLVFPDSKDPSMNFYDYSELVKIPFDGNAIPFLSEGIKVIGKPEPNYQPFFLCETRL